MQPSPDGRGSVNNPRVLYADAQRIVAAHGDPTLSAFLRNKKDYFVKFFTTHNTPASEVVTIVAEHERRGEAVCIPDEDDAYYTPAVPGGANRMVGANNAAEEEEEESDENTRIREAATRELARLGMLKTFRPQNISAHVARQLFVTIFARALGNYEEQLDLEKLLKRGRLMRTEGPSGPEWGTFYELSTNGVVTWIFNKYGVRVSWRVIERAFQKFRRFYTKFYGDNQSDKS